MFNNTSNLIDYKKLYEKLDGNYAVMSVLDKILPQKFVIVTDELPTKGVEDGTMYVVYNKLTGDYDEYVYARYGWEKIGFANISAHNYPITTSCSTEYSGPKLNMISCPCCGQGEVRKTKIDGIVECIYCNRQFTLSY